MSGGTWGGVGVGFQGTGGRAGGADSPSVPKPWAVSWKKRDRTQRGDGGANRNGSSLHLVPSVTDACTTNLEEAGVHGGRGADHVHVGSGCGADALEWGVGGGREGKVLRVAVLGAGAARGKAMKSLWEEQGNKESPPPPH